MIPPQPLIQFCRDGFTQRRSLLFVQIFYRTSRSSYPMLYLPGYTTGLKRMTQRSLYNPRIKQRKKETCPDFYNINGPEHTTIRAKHVFYTYICKRIKR